MKRDEFKISRGNIKVLETIPLMMQNKEYRKKIRSLVLQFIIENNGRGNKK